MRFNHSNKKTTRIAGILYLIVVLIGILAKAMLLKPL